MKLKSTLCILFILAIISCKQKTTEKETPAMKEPTVVSLDDQLAFNELKKLKLDSTYTNLLDPRNVTEAEFKTVRKSWVEFHKKVSAFIKEENFKWEVPDSTIFIVNKIYFDKNGAIDYYAFRILNDSVPETKREEYEKVLQKFSKEIKINLQRDEQFAQCGNTKYLNY
ncbi:hypothetical protein [Abyssalbus ytuae]|uniref:Lipoprotein n=1 Tax=Abyssalbus ytuae TaxID=2926907 RepID=A0A9E7CUI2_9FLAO|nr:hypothetical protein [Abyssalbus ytuae]UOB18477.1 hypothetical protein MQE35_04095 [Abyssalbus ytuae]